MQVQIKVFSGVSALQSDTRLFERILDLPDAVSVPFDSLVSTLKFLFGQSCIVSFNIM